MLFDHISVLKANLGVDKIEIVKNPNTGKLFGASAAGNLKVQASIDLTKPVRFMYESKELYSEGCITNVSESDNIQGIL